MHECPNCYETCDCDGLAVWFRVEALADACIHECERKSTNGGFMSLKKLTSENAIIKTAAVEVKTLTISGKQVTLAVFRQLPEARIIDPETCQFRGIPWGVVNYHPDKCSDTKEHIHVVWQDGSCLQRSRVFRSDEYGPYREKIQQFYSEYHRHRDNIGLLVAVWHLVTFLFRGIPAFELTPVSGKDAFSGKGHGWNVYFDRNKMLGDGIGDMWYAVSGIYHFMSDPDRASFNGNYGENGEYVQKATRADVDAYQHRTVKKLLHEVKLGPLFEEYLPGVAANRSIESVAKAASAALAAREKAEQERERWRKAYSDAYGQLAGLDQLYIAV